MILNIAHAMRSPTEFKTPQRRIDLKVSLTGTSEQ
jgi:hypothetical protein